MNGLLLIVGAIILLGLSGTPALLLPPRSSAGQRVSTDVVVLGSLLGLLGVAMALSAGHAPSASVAWSFARSRLAVAVDPLAAVFLLPVFVVPMLGSVYGLAYWRAEQHPENGRRLGVAYGLLAGAMALVVIARDGMLFLIAWEVMALAAYFAATAEDDKPEVRGAGWVYLIATHIGTLCLFAMFSLWRHATGTFALEAGAAIPGRTATLLFVLAVVGFGFKAGLMPFHVWLPGAHANAPSHVSAVMSGVMLKMGIYGIARMVSLLPDGDAWWGPALLAAGAVSSVVGIAYAIGQRDLKRILAYSSIENVGIIAMGLGLAVLGRSHGNAEWVLLGLGGALLHVWNHGLFKSLLFLAAGSVIHATHTRCIDRMGGLAKRLPRVAALFAVGAVAICALPPFNGFASEWLLYLGLFGTSGQGGGPSVPAAALAVVALAVTGALAVACFVRALGAVFLGSPRRDEEHPARDPSAAMLAPMVALAIGCAAIGLFPLGVLPLVESAVRTWSGPLALAPLAGSVPLEALSVANLAGAGLAAVGALVLAWRARAGGKRQGVTWDCGYARPTARMQYTGSSLGDALVRLTSFLLWPTKRGPGVRGAFPPAATFESTVPDTVLDRIVAPLFDILGSHLPWLRIVQQGKTNVYLLYILVAVVLLLLWGGVGS